ncbi:MAG: Ni/Fe hydrogenase [Gammaproteobacteria bacterium HGW-Gammaproteobacteria-3]|nr:MAG: Ni/Fe hydrogenase [Gammaproteobacteria bacterium HGW-Gammaproteobacteria-3]
MPAADIKPLLIFGYGNVSRGDDALGPLLLEFIEEHFDLAAIEIQTDFQLQIEHALDMAGRHLVLFVDASVGCVDAFDFTQLAPVCDNSYSTHAMSPAAVLQVYQTIERRPPPQSFLLSIQGKHFELGTDLSPEAQANLAKAQRFIGPLLTRPTPDFWLSRVESPSDYAEPAL